jgi:hypothetical protein
MDSWGLTEKLAIAWLTPEARLRRKAAKVGMGPGSAFISFASTTKGKLDTLKFEFWYTVLMWGPLIALLLLPSP